MGEAARKRDREVESEIIRVAEYLGIGVANRVIALHPDLVVPGGGVSKLGEILFATVRRTVRERVHMFPVDDVAIEPSELGDLAGTLGGIALAMSEGRL